MGIRGTPDRWVRKGKEGAGVVAAVDTNRPGMFVDCELGTDAIG